VVRVVVVIGLTSLVVVVVVTLALMALRSSCRTYASARLTVGVGLDQHVALVALVLLLVPVKPMNEGQSPFSSCSSRTGTVVLLLPTDVLTSFSALALLTLTGLMLCCGLLVVSCPV